ncbi:hypothetical protein J6Z48_01030 [bacterium]|nr:hypothetical protein [bacterium]
MKNFKIFLLVLLFVLFLPATVLAKEYCEVVSGNGTDIGSEIACGTEHFYVVDSDEGNVKMLSKYNIYVGANYDKMTLDKTTTYVLYECLDPSDESSCYVNPVSYFEGEIVSDLDVFFTKIKEKFNFNNVYSLNDFDLEAGYNTFYSFVPEEFLEDNGKTYQKMSIKLYPFNTIGSNAEGYALQNELALGVTGEKGKANYPIYATTVLFTGVNDSPYSHTENYDNFVDGYTDFNFVQGSMINKYLQDYNANLVSMGYEVSDVNLLSIKELFGLVKTVSGSELPLTTWFNASYALDPEEGDGDLVISYLGDLKQYLSNEYKWVWNTTYWTRTFVGNVPNGDYNSYNGKVYFVSTAGDICYSWSGCGGIPRAGIRPVVTIAKDSIKYKIFTKTDGNGELEVVDSAFGGETISFKVSAKKDFKLVKLTITTDSGESVIFEEGNIVIDSEGIVTIDKNIFTMPFENVTIEASWLGVSDVAEVKEDNPKTGDNTIVFVLLFLLSISIGTYSYIKKNLLYKEK